MSGFFDLNRDGKEDAFETALAMKLIAGLEELEEATAEAEKFVKVLRDKIEILEREQSELEQELAVLSDELSYIGGNEPEITSASFERWEERNALLEEQITEVEERIETLKKQILEISSQLND